MREKKFPSLRQSRHFSHKRLHLLQPDSRRSSMAKIALFGAVGPAGKSIANGRMPMNGY
jgi:hypothetical protein